jgi:hypothetical protein
MTSPDDGEAPSLAAASEKYSMLSDIFSGEGRGRVTGSPGDSLGDFVDRSEFVRDGLEVVVGDLGLGVRVLGIFKLKKDVWPVVIGDVAIGIKKGSTTGFVTAVCNAVKNRRGPAGLGMIMTSGMADVAPGCDARSDCITSLTSL